MEDRIDLAEFRAKLPGDQSVDKRVHCSLHTSAPQQRFPAPSAAVGIMKEVNLKVDLCR